MNKIKEFMGDNASQVKSRFFYLIAVLTIIYLGIQIYSFFILKYNPSIKLPYQFTIFVSVIIFGYMTIKETLRWTILDLPEHFGEYLLHLIIGSYFGMVIASFFWQSRFPALPEDFHGFVLTIFLIWVGSRVSKIVHTREKIKKEGIHF